MAAFLLFLMLRPCNAQITSDLNNAYLDKEFDWAIFVETADLKHYLNYQSSKLHPLTKVRVLFRPIVRSINPPHFAAEVYEEFWYHGSTPIGLRRLRQIKFTPGDAGIIVIGMSESGNDRTPTICNALVRLLLDVELKDAVVSVVVVPKGEYDQIASELGRYGFFQDNDDDDMQSSPSIHLRSYPKGNDRYYYTRSAPVASRD